jgi:hypothetical protein
MLIGRSRERTLFAMCVVLGIALRAFSSRRGWNFDTEMLFKIASLPAGANFYREYVGWANWGPIPYNIFQVFHALPGGDRIWRFHTYLACFFTACDVISSVVVWRVWGLRAAAWFLLFSPIAIVVSGYHCNAEPAIVAMVLVGYYLHVRRGQEAGSIHPAFLVCLGVSLALKHSFVLFPIWLALRPAPWRQRALILIVPYGVWFASALYYLIPTPAYFVGNVLSYGGYSGNALVPMAVEWILRRLDLAGRELRFLWLPLFLGAMLAIGWRIRRWPLERSLLLYPIAILVTTSAVALQYFNLASFSVAAHLDVTGVVFSIFSAYFYGGHPEELNLWTMPPWLQDFWMPVPHRTNIGWLICQGILAVLLQRRLSLWSDAGDPRLDVTTIEEERVGAHGSALVTGGHEH